MSIRISCSCGKRLRARDEHAGKRTRCPACGVALAIPSVAVALLAEPPESPAIEYAPARSPRTMIYSICAVSVLMAAGGAGGVMCRSDSDDPANKRLGKAPESQRPLPQVKAAKQPNRVDAADSMVNDPDLDLVPRDALGFVSLRIADWWTSPLGEQFQATSIGFNSRLLPWIDPNLGIDPTDVERATLVFSTAAIETELADLLSTIVSFRTSYDERRLRKAFGLSEKRKTGSVAYYVNPKSEAAYEFVNDRLFVTGRAMGLRSLLGGTRRNNGPLGLALQSARGKHLLTAALYPPSEWLQKLKRRLTAQMKPFEVFLEMKGATVFVDGPDIFKLDLQVRFSNEASAKKALAAARTAQTMARQAWTSLKNDFAKRRMEKPPEKVIKAIDDLLASDPFRHHEGLFQARVAIESDVLATLPQLFPADQKVRETANRVRTITNFKLVAQAMQSYHDAHKEFPPAVIMSKDGKPLYSWRVAILPYLELPDLYKSFHTDEPWDSLHNTKLLSDMPKVFGLVGCDAARPGGTFIQLFTGPQAAFDGDRRPRIPASFPDGLSNTILLAEAADAVPWTKPVDLVYAADKPVPKLGNHYGQGTLISTADGAVRFLNPKISEKTLRAAITPAGGEVLGPDW